jgi:Major tropism determinant N-terminal domain
MATKLIIRAGFAAQVPPLDVGELGYDQDKKTVRVGDGSTVPPRIPTDKAVGDFDFSTAGLFTFSDIAIKNGGKVGGIDLTKLNATNGILVRRGLNDFVSRNMVSSNNSIIFDIADGVAGNLDFRINPVAVSNVYTDVFFITTPIVKTVHGPGADFPDLNAAFNWLGTRRIATTGKVTLRVAPGVSNAKWVYSTDILISHPDGDRIYIEGSALNSALPTAYTITGTTVAARSADTNVNLAALRGIFNTELGFINGSRIFITSNIRGITNLLLTSDGNPTRADGTLVDGIIQSGGFSVLNNVIAVGFPGRGIIAVSAEMVCQGTCGGINCGQALLAQNNGMMAVNGRGLALSSSGDGICAYFGSTMVFTGGAIGYARGNAGNGASSYANSVIIHAGLSIMSNNGGNGASADQGASQLMDSCVVANNGQNGCFARGVSYFSAQDTTGTGNGVNGLMCQDFSSISRARTAVTGAVANLNPPLTTLGNNNSYIY